MPKDITDAELAVLQALWDRSGATIRELTDQLYGSESDNSHFATVQKLLERMQAKGFVARQRDASPKRFAASVSREQLIGRRLKTLAEKLCGGSLTPLLTHLVQNQILDARQRQELRDLIDRLDKPSRPTRR